MFSQILTFYSTHHALAAERILKDQGIAQTIVPTPRSISGNCGIAIRIDASQADDVVRILADEGVEVEGSHPLPED